jgi:hypothetical protein
VLLEVRVDLLVTHIYAVEVKRIPAAGQPCAIGHVCLQSETCALDNYYILFFAIVTTVGSASTLYSSSSLAIDGRHVVLTDSQLLQCKEVFK